MKIKYKYKFNKLVLSLSIVALVVAFAGVIYSLFNLLELFNMFSVFPAVDITSLIISTIIITVTIVLLTTTKYEINETHVVLNILFFKQKLPLKAISCVVTDKKTKDMVVYFTLNPETEQISYLPININLTHKDKFLDDLRKVKTDLYVNEIDSDKNNDSQIH